MPNDIDILMAHVQEINAKSASDVTDADITVLIAYHRHNRARRASGYKPAKLERPKVDVLNLLGVSPKPTLPKSTGNIRRV